MQGKKETKGNADMKREFAEPRFFWGFAQEWYRAKTSKKLAEFWAGLRTSLATYDEKHPTGRRLQPKPAVGTPADSSAHPAQLDSSDQQRNKKTATPRKSLPQAAPKITEAKIDRPAPAVPVIAWPDVPAVPSIQPSIRPPLPKPLPKPRQVVVAPPPPAPTNIRRNRSPSPLAGPSQPRATEAIPSSPSTDSDYVEGRRIPGMASLLKQQQKIVDSPMSDGSEYLPAIKVKHDPGRPEKVDGGKGKSKEGSRDEKVEDGKGKSKEEGIGGEKKRKPPIPTGKLRERECRRCVEKKMACYQQKDGKACLGCAQIKLKCEEVGGNIAREKQSGKGGLAATKAKAGEAEEKTRSSGPTRSQVVKPAPAKSARKPPATKAKATPAKRGTRPSLPISLSGSPTPPPSEQEEPPRKLRSQKPDTKEAETRVKAGRAHRSLYFYGKFNLYTQEITLILY